MRLEIGGQIPPFHAKAGMRAKISRENQRRSRDRLVKARGVCAQPREPFVEPFGEGRRRRDQGQRGEHDNTIRLALIGKNPRQLRRRGPAETDDRRHRGDFGRQQRKRQNLEPLPGKT